MIPYHCWSALFLYIYKIIIMRQTCIACCKRQLKLDGTRWHTEGGGGESMKNWRMQWVASTLHTTSEHGISSITTADAHTSAASSRLDWRPRRFKWTRPFRRKTKSGICACAITFQTQSNCALLRYCAACSSNSLPTFRDNQSVPSSKVVIQDKETCIHYVIIIIFIILQKYFTLNEA